MSNEDTAVVEELQEIKDSSKQEEMEISQFLAGLGSTGDWSVKLSRVEPKEWTINGRKRSVHGLLATYTSPFTEDDIFSEFGGGKYQIRVLRRDKSGKLKWGGGKTFDIAGDPRMPKNYLNSDDEGPKVNVTSDNDKELSSKALDIMERTAKYERDRAERERERADTPKNGNGNDFRMLELMMKQMDERSSVAQRESADLRRQLIESQEKMTVLLSKKPDTSFQDAIFGRIVDTKSAEISAIRTQHESELRTIRESNRDEIKRLEDRHDRDLENIRSDYKRQQEVLKDSFEHRIRTMELSGQQGNSIHEMTIKRLEHDLSAARNEITSLRSEKIKSPVDMIGEIAKLKENLDMLTATENVEGEEKPAWERFADKIFDSPITKSFAERLANPQASVPNLTQQQLQEMQTAQAERAEEQRGFTQKDITTAISFMEQAINAGKDPIEFARAAQSMTPKKLLDEIISSGPDAFADAIASFKPDSVVATTNGRKFVKAVVEFLSSRE